MHVAGNREWWRVIVNMLLKCKGLKTPGSFLVRGGIIKVIKKVVYSMELFS